MSGSLIIGGEIFLRSYIDWAKETRVSTFAQLPDMSQDGRRVYVMDWKITGARVKLTYQMSASLNSTIHEITLPVIIREEKLQKPSRSKFWKLSEFSRAWRNTKTGEEVYVD